MEKWKREVREVERADEGSEGALPPQYKLTALKRILTGKIRDQIRWKESELEAKIKEKGKQKHQMMPRKVKQVI